MACCGDRDKDRVLHETQKWDYINLSDFHARSCWTPITYFALFIALIVSIAVYVLDLLILIQLLIFSRWAGKVEPVVPFYITRWVFLGCIIASWVFLVFRYWRAMRAIKSGGIAQSYLDPLAVRIQSIRMGGGRGWKRFLVFAEMTKGKKGVDYIALFTYFSFEASYRIIFAEGPRNVINAMTLWAVLNSDVLKKDNKSLSTVSQFLNNVKGLADGDYIRAAVLIGMLFVLVLWVLAAISLILSVLFYIFFLWHQIPKSDRTLGAYCRRKVDQTLSRIVDVKVTKALNKADAKFVQANMTRGQAGESIANIKKGPTLPVLEPADKLPMMPLSRTTTQSSQQPTLPNMQPSMRPMISRSGTNVSGVSHSSYSSNSPLMNEAGAMGYAPSRSNTPGQFSHRGPISPLSSGQPSPHPPLRSNTMQSNNSGGTWGVGGPPPRLNTGFGNYPQGRGSPAPGRGPPAQEFEMRSQTPQGLRAATASPFGYNMPPNRGYANSPAPRYNNGPYGAPARSSPAPSAGGYPGSIYDQY